MITLRISITQKGEMVNMEVVKEASETDPTNGEVSAAVLVMHAIGERMDDIMELEKQFNKTAMLPNGKPIPTA